jgi:hypothetical protein
MYLEADRNDLKDLDFETLRDNGLDLNKKLFVRRMRRMKPEARIQREKDRIAM